MTTETSNTITETTSGKAINGAALVKILEGAAVKLEDNKDYLCELDSEVGDGDHGVSMTIGMRAARRSLGELTDPALATAFRAVAEAFADEVGASIGPLYEAAFAAAADTTDGQQSLSGGQIWADILSAMANAMQEVGKAKLDDKTLIDAWVPAAEAAQAKGGDGADAAATLKAATEAAWQGVEKTKELVPKLGRASRLGERARGFQDAGATSASILLGALYEGVQAA